MICQQYTAAYTGRNRDKYVTILITALVFGVLLAGRAEAESTDAIVKRFIAAQESKEDREGAKAQGSATADINGDGKPEIVVVWTTLGASWWRNNLGVLNESGKLIAETELEGEAELDTVRGQVIEVKQKTYAPDDPTCCPSKQEIRRYRLVGGKLTQEPAL